MFNDSGTYGPNEASVNTVSSINGSQCSRSESPNNLINSSKIMQQATSSSSGNYEAHNFPYFGLTPMNNSPRIHPAQAYQSIGQSSAYLPQNSLFSQENCSDSYLTATNPQSSQYVMNFPQNLNVKNLSTLMEESRLKESSAAKDYSLNVPQIPSRIFEKTSNFNKKVFTHSESEYDTEENTIQESTEVESRYDSNNYVLPEDLSLDIKSSLQKAPRDISFDLPKTPPSPPFNPPECLRQSLDRTDVISHSPLITEKKRKSLEKTVRLIESILTKAINNNTKPEVESSMKDPLAFSPKPHSPSNTQEITDSMEKEIDSDDEVLIKKVPIKNKRKVVKAKHSKKSTDVVNIELSKSIKQEVDEVNLKIEHLSWPDVDFSYPFLRDCNGVDKNCIDDGDIVGVEDSVNNALDRIKNGEINQKASYFECPHCSLLITHPKRFLVHTKWHTFGLLNEKRAEMLREREEKKEKRARPAEISSDSCNTKTFPCKDCDKIFITKSSMRSHRRKYHIFEQTQCRICLVPLAGQTALREHMATHEDAGEHQCPKCPKRFKFRHSLAKHADTHLEKTHGCTECSKMFGSALLVKLHMKTHERMARGTTYHCSFCGKGFYETYNLNVHERTHRNDKPFKCEICESRFVTNSSLTRHMKVSHSGAKPHVCKVCQKCFATESIRDRHELRVHTDQQQFRYQCKLCPRRYMKPKDLKNHAYKMHAEDKKIAVGDTDPNYDELD